MLAHIAGDICIFKHIAEHTNKLLLLFCALKKERDFQFVLDSKLSNNTLSKERRKIVFAHRSSVNVIALFAVLVRSKNMDFQFSQMELNWRKFRN